MGYMDHKERFFNPTNYNMVRLVNKLAGIVEAEGGTVDYHSQELRIYTRGYDEKIHHLKDWIDRTERYKATRCKDVETGQSGPSRALEKMQAELMSLEVKRDLAPVVKTRLVSLISDVWIRFELEGIRYSFSAEDNPFFPDSWSKVPVGSDGKYYMEKIEAEDKFYYPNDMFNPVAKQETIDKAAEDLFDFLMTQDYCERYA